MVLILFIPFFACSIFQLMILNLLPDDSNDKTYDSIFSMLARFANVWIVFLTIFHYYILKSFKAKYKKHPFKLYIFFAVVLSLVIACVTNLQFLKSKRIDSLIVDLFAFLVLGIVALSAYHFREEIKFGPYSRARESVSKLIRFSSMQAVFALLSLIQDIFIYTNKCVDISADERIACKVLGFTDIVIYQGWVWWAVFYNWKMFSVKEERESTESISNGSVYSVRSSAFLS